MEKVLPSRSSFLPNNIPQTLSTFYKNYLFLLVALSLHCCMCAFLIAVSRRGYCLFAVHGVSLIVAASLATQALGTWASVVVAHGLLRCPSSGTCKFPLTGDCPYLLHWQADSLTTGPPRKCTSPFFFFFLTKLLYFSLGSFKLNAHIFHSQSPKYCLVIRIHPSQRASDFRW